MKRCLVLILSAVAFAAMAQSAVRAAAWNVNMALDKDTVLIYAGGSQGIQTGDTFAVSRGGSVVGHLKAKRVEENFTYAQVLDGDVREMDTVTPAAAPAEKPKTLSEEKKERKAEEETPKKTTEQKIAESGGEAEKKPAPKPDKKPEPAPEMKPVVKKTEEAGPLPHPAAIGLSGIVYVPNTSVFPAQKGAVHFQYMSATDRRLQYRDTTFGLTYGLSKDIEAAFAYDSTKPTNLGATNTVKTNIFSVKYALPANPRPTTGKMPGSQLDEMEYSYAVGLYHFRQSSKSDSTTGGSSRWTASRFFGMVSSPYARGTVQAGGYSQSGNMLRGTRFRGSGFLAGFEYPVGAGGTKNPYEAMTILAEYDSKAFYHGVRNCWTLGLRYQAAKDASIGLNVVDVARAGVLSIGGSFGF